MLVARVSLFQRLFLSSSADNLFGRGPHNSTRLSVVVRCSRIIWGSGPTNGVGLINGVMEILTVNKNPKQLLENGARYIGKYIILTTYGKSASLLPWKRVT